MNKLRLLLSAGAMLSLVAGTANAGRLMGMQGDPNSVTGTGVVTMPNGFIENGSPYTGGQGLEGESAAPFSKPEPGTINMRVNSFVNEFPMAMWWTGQDGKGTGTINKQQSYGVYGWIRVDIGVDGMTKNGIRYGAFTEIRENNTTALGGAGGGGVTAGASVASSFAQSAAGDSGDNTLYVRHAFVYIGTDQLGMLRIGSVVNAMTLFEVGMNDEFDIGGWISLSGAIAPAQAVPTWPWADNGGAYMAQGIAYLSPVFAGFDFGVSFEPNNSTPLDGSGCLAGYVGCGTQSSSTLGADQGRYRNMINLAGRYRNTFGPIGLAASAIWTKSGKVDVAGGPQAFNAMDIIDLGAEVSINKTISLGGNVFWGDFNNNWALQPVGGRNALAWTIGAKYTMPAAPITLGINYFHYDYAGSWTSASPVTVSRTRTSQGIDVGATYGLGPGVVLLAEYAWGQQHQGGVNLLGGPGPATYNTTTAQAITAGMSVRF